MLEKAAVTLLGFHLLLSVPAFGQTSEDKKVQTPADDPEAHPPVSKEDLEIVEHARKILDSPAKWNRADNRKCPPDEKIFSLYCALEKATYEVTGSFAHRGAAMQEARSVIEEVAPDWKKYDHRLMDYNNDPKTTFADIQKVLQLLQEHIQKRLKDQAQPEAPKD